MNAEKAVNEQRKASFYSPTRTPAGQTASGSGEIDSSVPFHSRFNDSACTSLFSVAPLPVQKATVSPTPPPQGEKSAAVEEEEDEEEHDVSIGETADLWSPVSNLPKSDKSV